MDAITPSVYSVSVTAPGFAKKEVNAINVQASVITSQNITLEVGGSEQTITVDASIAQIQTQNR